MISKTGRFELVSHWKLDVPLENLREQHSNRPVFEIIFSLTALTEINSSRKRNFLFSSPANRFPRLCISGWCSQKLSEAIRQISPHNPGLKGELIPFQFNARGLKQSFNRHICPQCVAGNSSLNYL
jgi:hypothetical protein